MGAHHQRHHRPHRPQVFQLSEGLEHLAPTVEYVVTLVTADGSELLALAQGSKLEQARLEKRGIYFSEKTCGIISFEDPTTTVTPSPATRQER